jgi:hypothetical protein
VCSKNRASFADPLHDPLPAIFAQPSSLFFAVHFMLFVFSVVCHTTTTCLSKQKGKSSVLIECRKLMINNNTLSHNIPRPKKKKHTLHNIPRTPTAIMPSRRGFFAKKQHAQGFRNEKSKHPPKYQGQRHFIENAFRLETSPFKAKFEPQVDDTGDTREMGNANNITAEFGGMRLGDKRLDRRFAETVEQLGKHAQGSV